MRLGGLYFDVRPDNKPGCARWIRLFGLEPDDWDKRIWYKLAILLPCLQALGGRDGGVRLALKMLLDLEIMALAWRSRRTEFDPAELSGLGARSSRLGSDLFIGDGVEDEAMLEITFGPVSLDTYREHNTERGARRIKQVLDLVLPFHLVRMTAWRVGDSSRAPRLGIEEENSIMGVNTHLGTS